MIVASCVLVGFDVAALSRKRRGLRGLRGDGSLRTQLPVRSWSAVC